MKHELLKRYPLGNSRRVWKQDRFVLSTFSPAMATSRENNEGTSPDKMRNAVRTCVDAGFNLLELGWAKPWQVEAAMSTCEQEGIDLIYQNLEYFGGAGLSKEGFHISQESVRHEVNATRPYRCVVGYYIWDEPYLPHQLTEARRQMDMFQLEAPEKCLFAVAIPSYNKEYTWKNGLFADYLRRYVEMIQPPVLSLDYYPIGMKEHDTERQMDESLMWCDLGMMKLVAEENDMPMWFYYQGQNLHNVDFFIFPMVRLFMYAGALYGAKGLQHYTAWESVVGLDGGHGEFFADQKKIHEEFRQLGNTLMALNCRRVMHDDALMQGCPYINAVPGLANSMEESELLKGKLPYRTSVSEFEDAYGNRYLMVLNRDYLAEKKITLDLKAESRVYEVSRVDGKQYVKADRADKLEIALAPGDAVLYRIQNADEEAYTVEYILSK